MTGLGSNDLRRYQEGKRLTPSEAIRAKCCECMSGYVDGRESCTVPSCPLWPFMPYNESRRHFRQTTPQPDMIGCAREDMAEITSLEGTAEV